MASASDAPRIAGRGSLVLSMSRKKHAPVEPIGPDPVIEAYRRDLDLSLLIENLKKTPTERVLALMELQRLAAEAREAGRSARSK